MRIVVFGGSGFLGSHVVDALHSAGNRVTVFDLKESPYLPSGCNMIIGDILNQLAVSKAVEGADYVYNFAGIADLDDAGTKPLDTIRLNVEGAANILEEAVKNQVKRVIYASTIYVYSQLGGFYRCSKQSAEIYLEEYNKKYGLEYTILRFGTLYGPRADRRNSIYRYVEQALRNRLIEVSGSGDELREYIHVVDAARLSVRALKKEFINERVIITGHHPIKLRQLLYTINEMLDGRVDIVFRGHGNNGHYVSTPYSYVPKIGSKLTSDYYTDIGQGLLECLHLLAENE